MILDLKELAKIKAVESTLQVTIEKSKLHDCICRMHALLQEAVIVSLVTDAELKEKDKSEKLQATLERAKRYESTYGHKVLSRLFPMFLKEASRRACGNVK